MADEKIRRDQDDLDVDESISDNDGGVAELPEPAADLEDEDLDDDD